MRKNHISRKDNRPNLKLFDVEYIDLPEHATVSKMYVLPMKTLYINTAADPASNVDRVFRDTWDFAAFIGPSRFGLMLGL